MKASGFTKKSDLKGGGRKRSLRPEPSWLTVPAASSNVPAKWAWHYQRLTRLLDKLRAAQREHLQNAADTSPVFSGIADSATDEFDRDLLLSEATSEQDVIYEVEQALKRIESGSYGTCEVTGKPIPKARLRTIPWTRFSAGVELDLERDGTVRPAHLRELVSIRASGEPVAAR